MTINERSLKVLKEFAANLLVFAGSTSPDSVTEDMARYGISPTQLVHVMSDLGLPMDMGPSDDEKAMATLYRDVANADLPDGKKHSAYVSRLRDCILSIPSYGHYSALVQDYFHRVPTEPRPGRPDDESAHSPVPANDPAKAAEALSGAMRHMRDISRINYVVSGTTDLKELSNADLAALRDACVFVRKDLDRFTDRQLIRTFQDRPDLLGKLCAWRA